MYTLHNFEITNVNYSKNGKITSMTIQGDFTITYKDGRKKNINKVTCPMLYKNDKCYLIVGKRYYEIIDVKKEKNNQCEIKWNSIPCYIPELI